MLNLAKYCSEMWVTQENTTHKGPVPYDLSQQGGGGVNQFLIKFLIQKYNLD